jgi:hypothetical protein
MSIAAPTLIFVYNANGGWLSALRDAVHKAASPASYPCSLCALTYGAVSMRPAWRTFLARIGLPSLFLYRDEFRSDLDSRDISLPAILIGSGGPAPEVLVSAEELNALPDLPALTALLEARLTKISRLCLAQS